MATSDAELMRDFFCRLTANDRMPTVEVDCHYCASYATTQDRAGCQECGGTWTLVIPDHPLIRLNRKRARGEARRIYQKPHARRSGS